MDEVRIWAVEDPSKVVELQSRGRMEAESLLEDTLVRNPDLLIPGLRLVGRQTPTAGGPLDLLGVDRFGRLCLFELKRGTVTRDAVAQVIDYAADLEAMDLADLAGLISRESGKHGIDRIEDFEEWYGEQFGEQELTSLRPLRMFLVGLGTDERAERMVDFLANHSDMDISLITFHGFEDAGRTLLARQMRVERMEETKSHWAGKYVKVADKKAKLERRKEESGVTDLFSAVEAMFRASWPESSTDVGQIGLHFRLQQQRHARIDVGETGVVGIVFFPPAKALRLDAFTDPVAKIPCRTWPKGLDPLKDPKAEIQFQLTAEDWETHREALTNLARTVYEAYQANATP